MKVCRSDTLLSEQKIPFGPSHKKMNQMNGIIANNANGIDSMMNGQYLTAVLCFRRALGVVQASVDFGPNPAHTSAFCCALGSLPLLSEHGQGQDAFSEYTECFAMFPSPRDNHEANTMVVGVEVLSAALLYNMALALQLQGKCSGANIFSNKASTTYKMAARILQHLQGTENSRAIFLAVANNLAALSLASFDYDSFDCMRDYMTATLEEDDCLIFATNLAVSTQVRARPAAAA